MLINPGRAPAGSNGAMAHSFSRRWLPACRDYLMVLGVCALLAGAWWLVTLERVAHERALAVESAVRHNANLALALDEQTARIVEQAEQALLFLRHEYEAQGRTVTLRDLRASGAVEIGAFTSLEVVDARGYVVKRDGWPGTTNLADREFFAYHRQHPDRAARVGLPVQGRLSGRSVITVSRRITRADGSFGGVYLVGMDAARLVSGYRRFDLGAQGVMMLMGVDGISRARRTGERLSFGDDMHKSSFFRRASEAPSGNFVTVGRLEGVPRYVSYRSLPHYGLIVAVGTSVADTEADLLPRERAYYAAAAGATAILLALGSLLAGTMTRRRRAAGALAVSEGRYRATFDWAPVGIAHADRDGRFIRVNARLCEMLGYTEAELLARSWSDVTHEDDVRRARELIGRMSRGELKSFPEVEKRYRRKDGRELWGIATLSRIEQEDGSQYFLTILQDVTERKRAQDEARESERRFREMLGNVELLAITLDTQGRVTYCNDHLLQVTGWSRHDMLGRDVFGVLAPHDDGTVRNIFRCLLEADPKARHTESEIVTRAGERRSVRWSNSLLRDARGEVVGAASIGEDVTQALRAQRALLEAQARHRATFEQAAVGVTHTSLDGRFLSANRKMCDMLGYTEVELTGRRFVEITDPADVAASLAKLAELLASDPSTFVLPFEKRFLRKDGEVVWTTVAPAVVRDERGAPQYFVTMMQDITSQKRIQAALQESEAQFQQLAHNIPEAFWIIDLVAKRMVYTSPAFERICGRPLSDLDNAWADWQRLIHPEDLDAAREAYRRMPQGPVEHEHRIRAQDGNVRWVRARGAPIHDASGQLYRLAGTIEDVTGRRLAEEAIREAQARYRATFDQAAIGVAHATLDGTFLIVNRKLAAMLGYEPEELLGRNAAELTHPDDRHATEEARLHFIQHPEDSLVPEYEKRYVRKDGTAFWVSVSISVLRDGGGVPQYAIALIKDVNARKTAEAKLVHQAHYDALTELPNRTLFYDRLAQTLNQARRHNWSVAVMTIDLDRFNIINDTLGHEHGDRLLADVAKRLAQCVRSGDTVARLGGDEFGIIAVDLANAQDAGILARKAMDALALPFELGGQEVFVSASAGIATYPLDGRDGGALMKNADAAMFRAKQLGRNNCQFYAAAMNERAIDRLKLENDLRRALERDEFRLHFQAKAQLADGRVTGFEALLRWQRPGGGLVPPGHFIPLLEETGLIMPVGDWVIGAACAQLAEWRRVGLPLMPVAVNLCAKQFVHRDIVAVVDAALREHGVSAHLLEIEITESDAMQNPEATMAMLRRLKERGVRIAIDDFGTGYSSLSYLKRFPVDTLKLDRSFVQGLPEDADDGSIARAVITLAHSLGLAVVAEGVETAAQRDFLAREGCDQMQGYLLSRPVAPSECERLLGSKVSAPATA